MKYALLLNLLFLVGMISSQDLPPILKIKNAIPKWQHLVVDDHFELDTFGFNDQNKYNCCVALNFGLFNATIIVNNYCKNRIGDPHGYILQGIDVNSGKLKWQSIANNDNGLEDQEAYPYVYQRPDSNIDLLGFRKLGLPLTTFPGWRAEVPSVPIRRVFDIDTGVLLSIDTDETDTVGINTPWLNGLMMPLNEDKYAQVTNIIEDKQFYFKLRTMGLNPYNFDGLVHKNVEFTSDAPPNVSSFSIASNTFARFGDHSIVGMVTQQDQFDKAPMQSKIMKINMLNNSGEPDFTLDFEKNVENRIKFPFASNGNFPRMTIHEGLIFVSMVYLVPGPKVKTWLLCLDSLGNEVFYIPSAETGENRIYEVLKLIGSHNGEFYFLGLPTSSGSGADIVKISMTGEMQYLSSYEPEDPTQKFGNVVAQFSENKDIIFSTLINLTYSYVAAFDPKDFNIDLTSKNTDIEALNIFEIRPNPTTNQCTIRLPDAHQAHDATITDQTGRTLMYVPIHDESTEIDLSSLSAGLYFVSLRDSLGRQIGQAQKLVKME